MGATEISTMQEWPQNPRERYRDRFAATARAMAGRKRLSVRFEGNKASAKDGLLLLPVTKLNNDNAMRRLRGMCDSLTLWIRHHDPLIHRELAPVGLLKRAIFDAIEQMRCEFVGSIHLLGARHNLEFLITERLRARTENVVSGSPHAHTADVIALLVYETLNDEALADFAAPILRPWRARLTPLAQGLLADLKRQQSTQRAFARTLIRLIGVFAVIDDDAPWEIDKRIVGDSQEDGQTSGGDEQVPDSPGPASNDPDPKSNVAGLAEFRHKFHNLAGQNALRFDDGRAANSLPTRSARITRHTAVRPASCYRIFSTEHDRMVEAQELVGPLELRRLRKRLDSQLPALQGMVGRLAYRLQRRLYAKQLQDWEFDSEEGILDCGRLSRVITDPLHPLLFKLEKHGDISNTVVTLLIDNSGSMEGRKITVAAICSDILASTLERCGIRTEILGFTTRSWKGGRVRTRWLEQGSVPNPGRLNELLHIVYKTADAPWRRSRMSLGAMLRTSVLKENIDGEALQWAHNRLIARPEDRRILVVICDGAPIDDATLTANGHGYLERHLREVIAEIETRSPVELSAIGIGHNVSDFYSDAVTISDVDELGRTLFGQLSQLFESRGNGRIRHGKARQHR